MIIITVTKTISIYLFYIIDINTAYSNIKKNGPHKSQFLIFALNSSSLLLNSNAFILAYIVFKSLNIVSYIDSSKVSSILVDS